MATRSNELVPCENCGPNGLRMIEVHGQTVWARCNCAYGRMLSVKVNRPVPPQRAEPALTADEISLAIEGLASIPWFPKEDGARTMIADALARMCVDSRSSFELVRRMVDMYQQWPGVREMRICYCALIGPPLSGQDLHLAISEFYPDGFGPSVPSTISLRKNLPTGKMPPALDDAIWRARIEKDLTSIAPQTKAYALPDAEAGEKARREFLQQQHREAMDSIQKDPNLKPVTQADIDRAVQELRDKKARAELGETA